MSPLEQSLRDSLAAAFAAVAGAPVDPVLRRSQHADFQADGALSLARRLGRSPREVAAEVVRLVDLDRVCSSVEVSGPGFVNLQVENATLATLITAQARDARLGVGTVDVAQTVVVDYSGPNVAKEMHVGHLRTTILGDAAVRVLEWVGHGVVKANHLGDWGTPFGMLIEHLRDLGADAQRSSVGDLNAFYQAARVKFDEDPGFADRSRSRVVALQRGDEETRRLWRLLVAESKRYFRSVYDRLDVRLSDVDFYPESRYQDQLASIVDELASRGLLHDSAGAKVVYPQGFQGRDVGPLPLIVRKSDGGFGYAATDLAAIRTRCRDLRADRVLYFVGQQQKQHLAMVFAVAAEAGWLTPPTRAEHLSFGHVLGTDGRLLRSRKGDSVRLTELLDEAVARAAALLEDRPDLDGDTRAAVARAVGIGAIKYADLSNDRARDYVFDWDRMLSFTGNAGPYLQFARARIRSIFRTGGLAAPEPTGITLTEPAERALALELLAFPTVVNEVAATLEFHRLTAHLYAVATAFTALYETCPVLRAEPAARHSRLVLCDLTARVLAQGLELLGIHAPDRM